MHIFRSLKFAFMSAAILLASAPTAKTAATQTADNTLDILPDSKGKVTVIMMGMAGCPGTEEATPFITEFSKSKPGGAAVYRVDVPPPGKKLQKAADISPDLNYIVDNERKIADRLEFFFYPTTFVLDKDSVVRFSGGCKPEEIRKMVAEILAEQPGGEKKMYTPPLVKIGDSIPDFRIASAEGKDVSLKEICGDTGAVLFFSKKSCPFSVNALSGMAQIMGEFKDKKFNYAVISLGEEAGDFKNLYKDKLPGSIILVDKDKSISAGKFGVSAVPFFYVLDKDMKVVERKPFQYAPARTAVAKTLGVTPKAPSVPAKEAGAG